MKKRKKKRILVLIIIQRNIKLIHPIGVTFPSVQIYEDKFLFSYRSAKVNCIDRNIMIKNLL